MVGKVGNFSTTLYVKKCSAVESILFRVNLLISMRSDAFVVWAGFHCNYTPSGLKNTLEMYKDVLQ